MVSSFSNMQNSWFFFFLIFKKLFPKLYYKCLLSLHEISNIASNLFHSFELVTIA